MLTGEKKHFSQALLLMILHYVDAVNALAKLCSASYDMCAGVPDADQGKGTDFLSRTPRHATLLLMTTHFSGLTHFDLKSGDIAISRKKW